MENEFRLKYGTEWNLKILDRYFEVLPKTENYSNYVKKYTDFLVDYVDDQIEGNRLAGITNSGKYTINQVHFIKDVLDYVKYTYDNNMDEVSVLAQIINRSQNKKDLLKQAVNFYKSWSYYITENLGKEVTERTPVQLTKNERKSINKEYWINYAKVKDEVSNEEIEKCRQKIREMKQKSKGSVKRFFELVNSSQTKRELFPIGSKYIDILKEESPELFDYINKKRYTESLKVLFDKKDVLDEKTAELKQFESELDFITKTLKTLKTLETTNNEETVLEKN